MRESMVEILAYYADKQPEKLLAADDAGNEYSYAWAWESVKRAAQYLTCKLHIRTGDRVMVECNQDVLYLIVDLACELTGAVFVPVEQDASYDRKKIIWEETESKIWISKKERLDFADTVFYEEILANETAIERIDFPKADAVAEILYTTGTTGKSKGIVITNRANVAVAENIKYGVEMKHTNVELIPIPISHSHGIRCCYANLLNGGSLVLCDGLLLVKRVFELINKYKVTAMDISPSAAMLLIKISKGTFWEYGRRMDYIQIGTAALPEKLKEQLVSELPGVRLYNFYGSTESGRSCVLDFATVRNKSNCIGKPTKNAEIVFTDEEHNIIKADRENPGFLASKGDMNMSCYWKNRELTNKVMKDNYVFTNDAGYMDEEGYIYILGRKDDVINYNGIKIAPEEIEDIAVRYKGVKDAACVPQQDAVAGQIPKLFISLEMSDAFDKKAYIEFLAEHLDGNKIPKRIEIIADIPRTFNGKVKRKELMNL